MVLSQSLVPSSGGICRDLGSKITGNIPNVTVTGNYQ